MVIGIGNKVIVIRLVGFAISVSIEEIDQYAIRLIDPREFIYQLAVIKPVQHPVRLGLYESFPIFLKYVWRIKTRRAYWNGTYTQFTSTFGLFLQDMVQRCYGISPTPKVIYAAIPMTLIFLLLLSLI
jgi:hypothetical protein